MLDIESLIKEAVYSYAKKAIVEAILAKLPAFLVTPLSPVIGFFVGWILDIVYEHVYRAISFAITDIEIGLQKEAYDKAVAQLQEVLAKSAATDKEIQDAKEQFKKSFHDLIKFPPVQ